MHIVRVVTGVLLGFILAAPASAEPALWKVQGPHATVYLFGTVHVLKSTTQWRTAKIDAAFASSTALYEEVPDGDDATAMRPLVQQLGLDPAHPLSAQLDDAGKAKLAAFESAYGLPATAIDALRPWLAAITVSVLPMTRAGYDPKSGVDSVLRAMARTQGKSLMGFETAEQEMHFLADLPQQDQVQYLLYALNTSDRAVSQVGDLVDAWAAGDTAKLESMLNADLFKQYPTLYQTLIVQRNRDFAGKIEQMLKGNGVTFVAVGAGHLVGPDSVQTYLAKDGIQATRQ
jgi:uncharacterized protein